MRNEIFEPKQPEKREELEMELEYKIDIPNEISGEQIIESLDQFFVYNAMEVMASSEENRHFMYYETPDYIIQNNGWTLRCVSGFNPEQGDGKGKLRYDYKVGKVGTKERKEGKSWENSELDATEIIEKFNLTALINNQGVSPVAEADTTHIKRKIKIDETIIEFSLDIFVIGEKGKFQELEMELVEGDAKVLDSVKQSLRKVFPEGEYPEVHMQKYDRVLQIQSK